jgi:hypothetical protein
MLAVARCFTCEPLPDWLQAAVFAASIAFFVGVVVWAVLTIRHRRR